MIPHRPRPRAHLLCLLTLPLAALAVGGTASASAPPSTPPTTVGPAPSTTPPASSAPDGSAPEELPLGFVRLIDDTGLITVVVPETWTETDTAPIVGADGSPQPLIFAATVGIEEFNTTFASGMAYTATPYEADPEALIARRGLSAGCETIEVEPYEDPIFTGFVQVGRNCGESRGTWNMVVASPQDQSFTAIVQLQIESPEQQRDFDVVLESFTYAGDPTLPPGMLVPPPSVPGSSLPG